VKGGIFMKKYHLADALTAFEVTMAIALLGMAFFQIPADIAIWVFVLGELADALDGPCARRWPYPDDGKVRWWRTHVKTIEHISDIFIAVACMLYLLLQPTNVTFSPLWWGPFTVSGGAMMLGGSIIVVCILGEVTIEFLRGQNSVQSHKYADGIILARRWVYAFIGIGGGIFLLVSATSWGPKTKMTAIFAECVVGALLLYFKFDRATDPS